MGNIVHLGAYAEDVVTGFSGYVVGRADYLGGSSQVLLQPKWRADNDSGRFPDARWIDETRAKVDISKPLIVWSS